MTLFFFSYVTKTVFSLMPYDPLLSAGGGGGGGRKELVCLFSRLIISVKNQF